MKRVAGRHLNPKSDEREKERERERRRARVCMRERDRVLLKIEMGSKCLEVASIVTIWGAFEVGWL